MLTWCLRPPISRGKPIKNCWLSRKALIKKMSENFILARLKGFQSRTSQMFGIHLIPRTVIQKRSSFIFFPLWKNKQVRLHILLEDRILVKLPKTNILMQKFVNNFILKWEKLDLKFVKIKVRVQNQWNKKLLD